MIDIGITPAGAPLPGIDRPGAGHVIMNFLLQIDAGFAKGAHHYIGADTSFQRDIPSGILDAGVRGIVTGRNPGLIDGAFDELLELG